MIYLDHNATTPVLPEVAHRMAEVTAMGPLNPSSPHRGGDAARDVLDASRESVAALLGCDPERLYFTGSGTEANNAVLRHGAYGGAILTTEIEHSSVIASAESLGETGVPVRFMQVSRAGRVEPEAVEEMLERTVADGPVGLVSVQWVNNETGVIQPIEEILEICQRQGVPLHVDAAQAVGKLPIDLAALPVDFLSMTGHKIHAPAGVGALFARAPIRPWMPGGDQERGHRGGTENLIGIAGLGAAAEARRRQFPTVTEKLFALRNRLESPLLKEFPWLKVNGDRDARIGNTSNIHFVGLDGQAVMAQLDVAGICVSQSSACTSHKPTPSYVLAAMGLSESEAFSSVRFSVGETNTEDEIDQAVAEISLVVERLSALEKLA